VYKLTITVTISNFTSFDATPEQYDDDGPNLLCEEAEEEEADRLWRQELLETP
jgi:hypothetical protein